MSISPSGLAVMYGAFTGPNVLRAVPIFLPLASKSGVPALMAPLAFIIRRPERFVVLICPISFKESSCVIFKYADCL